MSSPTISIFLLVSVAIAFSLASLLSSMRNNQHSSLGRTFLASIVSLAIIYQFHLLLEASTHVTSGSSTKNIYRWECLHSRKGGKRPFGDTSEEYLNPCYNITAETNLNNAKGVNEPQNIGTSSHESSSLCSSTTSDGSTTDNNLLAVEPYISAARDCSNAQSGQCTLTEPCIPCELSRRREFHDSIHHTWSRCQACSIRNNYGECGFVDGVGPYCWKSADSWEVVPCRKCCTESQPLFEEDGVCY